MALTPDKLEEICDEIEATPRPSTKKLTQQVQVSQTTVHPALKRLDKYPYRMPIVQELKPPDLPQWNG